MMARSWPLYAAFAGLGAVGLVAMASCKNDPAWSDATSCERAYSVCSDQPPVPQDVTDCARIIDGPCGLTMRRYVDCVSGKCDDAGAIDRATTTSECGTFLEAYRSCASTDAGIDAARRQEPTPAQAGDGG